IIHRRDSPNGKRYAHRGRSGKIEQAFGFNLAPLIARANEFSLLAQQVVEERRALKLAKEALSICRRDIRKLLTAAIEEGVEGDWAPIEALYANLVTTLPRSPSRAQIDATLGEMEKLRRKIINTLEMHTKTDELASNDIQNGCHIQNPEPESIRESEESIEKTLKDPMSGKKRRPDKAFPLSFVIKACPQIINYTLKGRADHWPDLISGAVVVR